MVEFKFIVELMGWEVTKNGAHKSIPLISL